MFHKERYEKRSVFFVEGKESFLLKQGLLFKEGTQRQNLNVRMNIVESL